MKSIKPGRGPSMMSGISCILVALFGIGWTVIAAATAPFMTFFGLIFVAMAVVVEQSDLFLIFIVFGKNIRTEIFE